MAYCNNCGGTLGDYDRVCSNCGTPVARSGSVSAQGGSRSSGTTTTYSSGLQNDVISSWGYVGSLILMGLPIVGFIITIVWAAGGASNQNRRNLARAYLLILAITIGIMVVVLVSIIARFGSLVYYLNYLSNMLY